MNRNYIATIEGNETVLAKYVEAVFAGTCRATKAYPNPYRLPGYRDCLDSPLIAYYLQQQPFVLAEATEFVEKLRKIDSKGFNGIHYPIDKWLEATVRDPFFTNTGDKWNVQYVLNPGVDLTNINPDYLKFMCYVAVCHLKFGPSYASVTANRYFDMVTALGSDEVAKLKKFGSGTLPLEVTDYKDASVSCVANDAFATIKIAVKQEGPESYRLALGFLNKLLQTDFPRSYTIEFSAHKKHWLPIKGLPKKGVNALFGNAVRYEILYPLLVEYANLAMKPHEWYNNLSAEDCAMPSTFAVFALGLVSDTYFSLITKYMRTVDEEHQSIQEKFTLAFVARFGINKTTLPVFMHCLLSTQSHKHYKLFAEQFGTRENLALLLACKHNFVPYLPEESQEPIDPEFLDDDVDTEQQSLIAYLWEDVLNAIFGSPTLTPKLLKAASEELRPLYTELF
ncbi:DUF6138 family protein [Hymenobacter sp. H14-R3]|uniref:DUF6138 family protein n=1 Tax=Hymenobacter sp. H14-R3 TaxID=3046308 RepID=UPI0024BBBCF7|nr:DUF6138 family protein [Hymenobacter sp. H14-R3]MDJ0364886.1 DUF6138 family protein [Hymenobacter sp. H14-R3]